MAWAALGAAYELKGSFLAIDDLIEKGVEMERRALELDPDLVDAHVWLGRITQQARPALRVAARVRGVHIDDSVQGLAVPKRQGLQEQDDGALVPRLGRQPGLERRAGHRLREQQPDVGAHRLQRGKQR